MILKSDSETGEKVPSDKRRSSTTSFVNYHFLSKNDKKLMNGEEEMEVEEPSILSKIPGFRHLETRRTSNSN